MISVLSTYGKALELSWKSKRLLFWLYGANLIIGYLLTIPISMMLMEAMDGTTAANKLLEAFDITYFSTIFRSYGNSLSLSRGLFTFGLFYMILNVFFSGGIIGYLRKNASFKLSEFLSDCVRYFIRFFNIFLISLLYLLGILVINSVLSALSGVISEGSSTEYLPTILFALRMLVIGFFLTLYVIIFDYARIMTVVHDLHAMFKTVKTAIAFVIKNFLKVTSLYLLLLLTAVLFLLLYLLVESWISVTSGWTVLIFFIWSQLYILSRIWIRLGFLGGPFILYKSLQPA